MNEPILPVLRPAKALAVAFVVAAAAGVGLALRAVREGPPRPLATSGAAPRAPGTGSAASPAPPPSPQPVGAPQEPAVPGFALALAWRLADAHEEAAAYALLEEHLAARPDDARARARRDALLAAGRVLLAERRPDLVTLRRLGRTDLLRERVEALRTRLPAPLHADLAALLPEGAPADRPTGDPSPVAPSQASEASVPAADPRRETYALLLRNLGADADAEGHFELAEWARKNGLAAEARHHYERAIALDAFHEGARKALGHVFRAGRWHPPERAPAEARPPRDGDDAAGRPTSQRRENDPSSPTEPTASARVPLPPPSARREDTAWYDDHERNGDFAGAPVYASRYYRIKTNVKREYARRYGRMLDRYFKRFVRVFRDFLPAAEYEPCEVWIYASQEEFRAATKMPQAVGGFYDTRTKRVTAYHGRFGCQGTTRDVLAHEGTHQFEDLVLQGKFENAPIWILEGLAVLFESAAVVRNEVKIGLVPRERLYALKRGLAAGKLIPLDRLIRTPKRAFTGYHYAHAWSLIYMVLYYGKSPRVRRRCVRWFSDLFTLAYRRAVTPQDVVEGVGGAEAFAELEAKWKEWIAELPYDFDPSRRR